jgi:hypothetical protein
MAGKQNILLFFVTHSDAVRALYRCASALENYRLCRTFFRTNFHATGRR